MALAEITGEFWCTITLPSNFTASFRFYDITDDFVPEELLNETIPAPAFDLTFTQGIVVGHSYVVIATKPGYQEMRSNVEVAV